MLLEEYINDIVADIVQGYDPEKIYLFGSCASNSMNKDSDLDFFIIKETKSRAKDRSIEVLNIIKNYPPVGLDVIVFTPTEMEAANKQFVNIGKEAIKTGRLLYERI